MIEDSEHGVSVSVLQTTDGYEWAEVDVGRYPDGSVTNELNAHELKQVADMLYAVAERMEGASVS